MGTAPLGEVVAEVSRRWLMEPTRSTSSSRSVPTSLVTTSPPASWCDDVSELVHGGTSQATLKVILETGVLHEPATIKAAAAVAVANGADFLKTSTGKLEPAATPEAAAALLEVIAAAQRTGQRIGLKVAGGVKTVADAAVYLDLADRLSASRTALTRATSASVPADCSTTSCGVLGSSHDTQLSAEY